MKKKVARDTELLQQKVDTLMNENDKLNKSKRKLQSEVLHFVIILQFSTNSVCWIDKPLVLNSWLCYDQNDLGFLVLHSAVKTFFTNICVRACFLSSQIDDLNVAVENERAKFAAVDKKQKKFDQSLAEEKAISER